MDCEETTISVESQGREIYVWLVNHHENAARVPRMLARTVDEKHEEMGLGERNDRPLVKTARDWTYQ